MDQSFSNPISSLRVVLGRLEAALSVVSDSIVIVNCDFSILWSNQSFLDLCSSTTLDVLGCSFWDVLSPWLCFDFVDRDDLFLSKIPRRVRVYSRDDGHRAFEVEVSGLPGEVDQSSEYVVLIRDISHVLQFNRIDYVNRFSPSAVPVHASSRTCVLTGLPLGSAYLECMKKQFLVGLSSACLYVYSVKIEGLQSLYSLYGSSSVGMIVSRVRDVVQSVFPDDALFGRVGFDDISVSLLMDRSVAVALQFAHQIVDELRIPCDVNGSRINLQVCVGLTCSSSRSVSFEEMLFQAETARIGLDSFSVGLFHASEMRPQRLAAFDSSAFASSAAGYLDFLPIVHFSTGVISSFSVDALTDNALPSSDSLIGLPNLSMSRHASGPWLLNGLHALLNSMAANMSQFPAGFGPYVFLRLSIDALASPACLSLIKNQVAMSSLDASSLVLRVSADIASPRFVQQRAVLHQLRRSGFRVFLDDVFSDSVLVRMASNPWIDGVVIDDSLVNLLGVDQDAELPVAAIVRLASRLGLTVVASGVSSEAQRSRLQLLGVEFGFGALFEQVGFPGSLAGGFLS